MDAVTTDAGREVYEKAQASARGDLNLNAGVKNKNGLLVAAVVELLLKDDVKLPCLRKASESILDFAKNY